MSKLKKAIVIYLVVSSVILHGLVAYATIVFVLPAIQTGREWADEAMRSSSGQAVETGVVKDISKLSEGEYSYVGYAVDYEGQTIYVMGATQEDIKIGDEVEVSIGKHPYGPLKALLIVVKKK